MIATRKKTRLPLKWPGGKQYLARQIVARIPATRAFAEHFAGGMAVGMNLRPLPFQLANDADPDLMNFWGELRRSAETGLLDSIRGLAYSAETFASARLDLTGGGLSTEAGALAFLVVKRMSRGALGRDFAWSDRLRGKRRPGGPVPGDLNAWETMVEGLPLVVDRIASIRLTCREAVDSIRDVDAQHGPDVVHYCDPPYLHSTRTHRRAYAREMTDDQHARAPGRAPGGPGARAPERLPLGPLRRRAARLAPRRLRDAQPLGPGPDQAAADGMPLEQPAVRVIGSHMWGITINGSGT